MAGSFVGLNYACEESFADYLISQCDPLETTASYYTGIGDVEELMAPAVLITADDGTETHPFSNVYDMLVHVYVKEMAADVSGSTINPLSTNPPLGALTANIYNALCNTDIKYLVSANNQYNFVSSFVMKLDNRHQVREDALISEIAIRVVGAISGSQ